MDIKKLMEDADALTIARYLGMQIVQKGRYYYIHCPGHIHRLGKADEHIGNCILTKHGYKCFACGVYVSLPNMVMEYLECDRREAYHIIAEAMGGEALYSSDDEDVKKDINAPKMILSPYEAKVLMIYPYYTDSIKGEAGNTIRTGLFELYKKNKMEYYRVIKSRAEEMYDKYSYIKKHYADHKGDKAYRLYDILGDSFDRSVYKQLSTELDERIEVCNRIKNIFSGNRK